MKNIAIILAGGKGNRLGADIPKQFIRVNGRMIIEHTIDVFERHPLIDEIAIVSRSEYAEFMRQTVADDGYSKVTKVLTGGKERYHSSLAAIEAYTEECNLLIHDGVRPMVSPRIITDCITALRDFEAVEVAVPATDTIIEVDAEGAISRIPPRHLLRNVQTPQCFRRSVIARAFSLALADKDFFPTDDCSIVHRYLPEVKIRVVDGEQTNIKITYSRDIDLMKTNITNNADII